MYETTIIKHNNIMFGVICIYLVPLVSYCLNLIRLSHLSTLTKNEMTNMLLLLFKWLAYNLYYKKYSMSSQFATLGYTCQRTLWL